MLCEMQVGSPLMALLPKKERQRQDWTNGHKEKCKDNRLLLGFHVARTIIGAQFFLGCNASSRQKAGSS
jgi:hypothetical protein